jgi:hypothetical protein
MEREVLADGVGTIEYLCCDSDALFVYEPCVES